MLLDCSTNTRQALDTRTKLVETARRLFWTRGYEATSVAEILKESGVNSGSLYHFFGGKEELLLAVLERYEELLEPAVVDPARERIDEPIGRIFAILEGYRDGLLSTGFTHGCPIGNLALEVAENHPAAREGIRKNFAAWREAVECCLREVDDELPDDADPARIAAFVLTVMEGGVMQARVEREIGPFDACVEELRNYFRRMLGREPEFEKVSET